MEPEEVQTFRGYLEEEGLKCTPARKLIVEEVFRTHCHFEAEDILINLRTRNRRVSRASVYRTLPLLVESGLLREVHSSEKHSHYEHVFGHEHHDHLICIECGHTIEFCDSKIEEMQDRICREYGFRTATHKLEITGVCRDCSASG